MLRLSYVATVRFIIIFVDFCLILRYTLLNFFTVVLCFGVATLLSIYLEELSAGKFGYIAFLAILVVTLLITLSFIYLQPVSGKELTFSVLYIYIYDFSILYNIILILIRYVCLRSISLSFFIIAYAAILHN